MSIVAALFAGSTAFAQTSTATAATISGSVVDDSGAPIAGTKVYYNNSPATVRDQAGHFKVTGPVVSSNVVTAKDGTFSITALPSGVYWLCAEILQPTQIRSCDWGFGGTKTDLTTAASATNVKLQVHTGVTLMFQVTDTGNQIQDFPSDFLTPGATGNFRVFVVAGTLVKLAEPISSTGGVHHYGITVPTTQSLRILLDTKLNVLNQKGTAVVPGKPDDTIAVSGQPVTYKLTVQ
jgi:hypothetical protein